MRAALLLAAAVLIPHPGGAQQTADDSVARAVELQDAGRWIEGRDLLLRQLDQCAGVTEPGPCRVPITRALGYIHQRQARLDPPRREFLLARAARYYNDALNDDPGDRASLTNLVLAYRALGRDAELEALMRRAADHDTDRAGFYALLLGDYYERRGVWDSARVVYARAIAAAPQLEPPRRRLVAAYAHLPADSAVTLFAVVTGSPEWEARFPDATARAYELVVSRLTRRDSATAVRACFRWVSLLAETQLLTVERLDAVGETWLAPYLGALKAFVVSSARPPSTGIWMQSDGREAVGRVALALGRRHLAAGDLAGAEAYFAAGMQAGAYAEPVSLDIAIESAAFYNRHPTRDSGATKFRMIEERLLSEKAAAYERADREAIQRFHTVLGLIYAQRGIWRQSDVPWTNAVYQLEHALATARSRDAAEGSYQPLPQLRASLAEGYLATGRSHDARAAYVEAAQAYLDLDQLPQASRVLERGKSLAGLAPDRRLAALDDLIRNRGEAAERTERPAAERCDADAERTRRSARAAGLGDAFAQRQGFKLLADCLLAGPAQVRAADAARVLTAAANDSTPLVGVGDLMRVQQSQAVVNQTLRLQGGTQLDQTKVRPKGPALRLQLPTERQPTYLPLDPDAVKGAAVLQGVGGETAISSIRVTRGVVTVATDELSDADRSRLQGKLGRTAVIQSAQVRADSMQVVPPPKPDVKTALSATVEQYARALESHRIEAVRRVVRNFDEPGLQALFERAPDLRVQLELRAFEVRDDAARGLVRGMLRYHDRRTRAVRGDSVTFRATFVRVAGEWRMQSIR